MLKKYNHLLLVDDDQDDQELFLTALGNIDETIECAVANNGEEAFQMLCTKLVSPDLIFLDINMPLVNGTELFKQLKTTEDLKNIPVIIYSTASSIDCVKDLQQLGASHFVSKPESFDELELMLKQFLLA